MTENTTERDLPRKEKLPTFSQRVLSRIPFLSKDKPTTKEPEITPQWYLHIVEGMSPEDQQSIQDLRKLFTSKRTTQRWYYSGSGSDISPTIIAPYDTEHWMVDVGYDSTHRFFRTSFNQDFSQAYQKLGAKVETATPWDEGWKNKRQTVIIDGKTKLQLIGGKTEDKETTPDSIDVIYTNPYSTSPGPDAWIALKTGGYYIVASDRKDLNKTKLLSFNKSLEDFGIHKLQTVKINSLHFPKVGKVAGTTDKEPIWYQVYEKPRSFTPEEEDILQLDSSINEIQGELINFIYNSHNSPENVARKMESDLSIVFMKYFDRIHHLKGNSDALSQQVQTHMEEYFPKDGTFPESFRNHDMFKERDNVKVIKFHKKAAEIYRLVKE